MIFHISINKLLISSVLTRTRGKCTLKLCVMVCWSVMTHDITEKHCLSLPTTNPLCMWEDG